MRGNTIEMRLEKGRVGWADSLYQYDYGQRLILTGVDLPTSYEVHFSNQENGQSKTMIGDSTGVDIPDEYLLTGKNIHVWVYLHDGTDDGETEYHGMIGVTSRAQPTDQQPTPVQQDVITQTIAALNAGVEAAETAQQAWENMSATAETLPEGSAATASYASGVLSIGVPVGATGAQGAPGKDGVDGFSPSASVSKSGNTATISITDKDGPTSAQISDGKDGATGATPVISIGTVSKLSPGSNPTASMDTTDPEHPVLSLGLVTGDTGEVTQAEFDALQIAKADIITDTASGAIASFPDGADGMPVQSLSVAVEPVQDLHGYENPWPAGGGKNLIPYPYESSEGTKNGINITVKNDGSLILNGTATSSLFFNLVSNDKGIAMPAGKYVLHKLASTVPAGVNITAVKNMNYWNNSGNNDTVLTLEETANIAFYIYVANGTTLSNLSVFPMFESGETVTDWTPYSNICPISGHTGANVSRTGKNLVSNVTDKPNSGSVLYGYYGYPSWAKYGYPMIDKLFKAGTYTVSMDVESSAEANRVCIWVKKPDGEIYRPSNTGDLYPADSTFYMPFTVYSTGTTTNRITASLKINEDVIGIYFGYYSYGASKEYSSLQIEIGDISAYEPYSGSTVEYEFPQEAGTVYGGTLTVNEDGTGEMVVDRAEVNLGMLNWGINSNNRAYINNFTTAYGCALPQNAGNVAGCIAEQYEEIPSNRSLIVGTFAILQTKEIFFYYDGTNLPTGKMVYPLATPVTYQLTNQQVIETLKGINNVWADTGDTAVTYRADTKAYINKVIAAAVAAL